MKLFAILIAGFLIVASYLAFRPQPKVDGPKHTFTVIVDSERTDKAVTSETYKSIAKILRARFDDADIQPEILFSKNGESLLISVAENDTPAITSAREIIEDYRPLNFHLVHQQTARLAYEVESGHDYVPGYELKELKHLDANGSVESIEPILITRYPDMSGSHIESAQAIFVAGQGPMVFLNFDKEGTQKFYELTRDNIGERLAIVHGDKVLSAPSLRAAIAGGSAQIDGMASEQEAQDLASSLQHPLIVPLKIIEETAD